MAAVSSLGVLTIRRLLALAAAAVLGACGGGGSSAPPSAPDSPATVASWIRFEGDYQGSAVASQPAFLTVKPLAGNMGIAANAVAKVEVQTNNETPMVLTSPNSSDAQGKSQYVFKVPFYESISFTGVCETAIPLRIVVTDVTGFSFTKSTTFCPAQAYSFTGLSDYGDRATLHSATASQPATATVVRYGSGGYSDTWIQSGVTSVAQPLLAREGDELLGQIAFTPSGAAGLTATTRIEADGGAFAESIVATNSSAFSGAAAYLVCCRRTPTAESAGVTQKVQLAFEGLSYDVGVQPPVEYDFSWRVTDPATGIVARERSGSSSNRTVDVLDLKIGYEITLQASLKAPATNSIVSVAVAHLADDPNTSSAFSTLGTASSNVAGVPARLKVFCCSK